MDRFRRRWTDDEVEQIMGNLLRAGVLLAAALVLIGAVIYLVHNGDATPNYSTFHGEPDELRNAGQVLAHVLSGSGRDVIQLGLLVLIGTPVARVVFSVVAFALQRDRTFVLITLVVLTVLFYSLIWGTV